jgi:1-deoxy-D-xylulose 5-phosphate reductoisomerase
VNEFLNKRIKFTDISIIIESVMSDITHNSTNTLDAILSDDAWARDKAEEIIRDKVL